MEAIREIIVIEYYQNSVGSYIIAVSVFFMIFFLLYVFKSIILGRAGELAKETETRYDDLALGIANSVGALFFAPVSAVVAIQFLVLPEIAERVIVYAFWIALIFYGVLSIQKIIHFAFQRTIKKRKKAEPKFDSSFLLIADRLSVVFLWLIAGIIILQIFGLDLATLFAGVGLVGIAVAFALRNVLADIFAYFSILYDKPFKVGDYVEIGGEKGNVKFIGLMSTRFSTLTGSELIMPNAKITKEVINNYRKIRKRRVAIDLDVGYDTSMTKMKRIPKILEKIVEKVDHADFGRAHFKAFEDSGLRFSIIYYIDTRKFATFIEARSEINMAIKQVFEKEKITIPFPTQTVHIRRK